MFGSTLALKLIWDEQREMHQSVALYPHDCDTDEDCLRGITWSFLRWLEKNGLDLSKV